MVYQSYYRKKNFDPKSVEPFKLSRSKVDLFIECPRCFYLDRRLGIGRPSGPPFTLNSAVDHLLKKEFDIHRSQKTPHPLMETYGINAIPFMDDRLNQWRENFVGIQYLDQKNNFILTGAVDDIWQDESGNLIVVDYKATAKDGEVIELTDASWHDSYRRQMEFYQWLLRKNEFNVSDTGYFVYANGRKDLEAFDGKLEFRVAVIAYTGNDNWVEKTLLKIKQCLQSDDIPEYSDNCEYCSYRKKAQEVESVSSSAKDKKTKIKLPKNEQTNQATIF